MSVLLLLRLIYIKSPDYCGPIVGYNFITNLVPSTYLSTHTVCYPESANIHSFGGFEKLYSIFYDIVSSCRGQLTDTRYLPVSGPVKFETQLASHQRISRQIGYLRSNVRPIISDKLMKIASTIRIQTLDFIPIGWRPRPAGQILGIFPR